MSTDPAWLDRELYPFAAHEARVPEGRVHYVDEGAGPPVLLVHGNPTWSFLFRDVITAIRGTRRAVAPDLLGFGLSDKPAGFSYLPVDQARVFAAVVDELDLSGVTVVVGDWGGPIGLSWALDNPDRVAGIVVTNTWLWSVAGDWYYRAFSGFMGGPVGRRLILRRNFFAGSFLARAYGDRSRLTPRIHEQYLRPLGSPQERQGCAVFPREIIGSSRWLDSLWQRRSRLDGIPMTLVWGMSDIAFREKELLRWEAAFPQARTVRLEGCGHFVAEERPADLAAEILALGG